MHAADEDEDDEDEADFAEDGDVAVAAAVLRRYAMTSLLQQEDFARHQPRVTCASY